MQSDFFENHIHPVRDKLFRFACRITGDAGLAEDVVQDVFMKVWRQKENFSEVQNWEAWCMTITRNLSINRKNSEARKPQALSVELAERSTENSYNLEALENQEMMEQLKKAMSQLPENQRLCMHLRDVEEMTYAEICTALDLTLDQVKTNIHRARKTMRTLIDKDIFLKN